MSLKLDRISLARLISCISMVSTLMNAAPAFGQCQRTKLLNPDTGCCDEIGWTVDIDGDLAVAASGTDADYMGGVYTYRRNGNDWEEGARLEPDDPNYILFGTAHAAVSGNVVVACGWQNYHSSDEKSVFVYRRTGSQWVREAVLHSGDPDAFPNFGLTAAIDDAVIFVSVEGGSDPATSCVQTFRYNSGAWEREQVLRPEENLRFYESLAISGDAAAVLGAASDPSGDYRRVLYIYRYSGSAWEREQILTPPSIVDSDFGRSIDLQGDDLILRSVEQEDDGLEYPAYIYRFNGVEWVLQARLSTPAPDILFGVSCGINGETALLGWSWLDAGGPFKGEVMIYRRTDSAWTLAGSLFATNPDEDSWFGASVALTGQHAIVGAPLDSYAAGAVYIYDLNVADCNLNSWCDDIDIAEGWSEDFDGDGVPEECGCPGDLNGDRVVDLSDLAILLANFNTATGMTHADGDLDFDGDVDLADLAYLLGVWGDTCPFPA